VRVSTKLTLGISAVSLLIAGVHGWRQMRQERQDLRNAVEREVRILGSAIQVSFEHALRDRQFTDIQGALDSLEGIAPDLDLYVFSPGGELTAVSAGAAKQPTFEAIAKRAMGGGGTVLDIDASRLWRVTLGLPLVDDAGANVGAIVLVRPLDEMRRDLHDTRLGIAISLVALVGAITALEALLGTVWVGRPLTKMAAGMHQLRHGEPASALATRRNDEVGRLAEEFDALVADLRDARDRIAREVESRLVLEQALQRVDKLATIGQLSAGLAHEIGSPLQIMSGRARALLTHELGPEEIRKNATILAEQADRIAGIVEQLLSFARRRPVRPVVTDLVAPVRTILDLLAPAARRRHIDLAFSSRPDLPEVLADIDQIQQVVLNLLKNALAATPDGGHIAIRLDLATTDAAEGPIAAARLEVEDDGCGMDEETRARLFEPFFTTRAGEGGTGLGLAVVRAILQAHGGSISVASSVGAGTRFTIDLPLRGAHA
jgi:two-component system, NtrC family, sensor histidine kinase HydH